MSLENGTDEAIRRTGTETGHEKNGLADTGMQGGVECTGRSGLTYIHYFVYNSKLVGTCRRAQGAQLSVL